MKKIITIIALIIISLHTAHAAITIPDKYRPANISPGLEVGSYDEGTINAYLQFFAGKIIKVAGPLAVLMIVVASLYMATSRGEEQAEEGKKKIKFVLYGLAVILISFVLVQAIISIIYSVDTASTTTEQSAPNTTSTPAQTESTDTNTTDEGGDIKTDETGPTDIEEDQTTADT